MLLFEVDEWRHMHLRQRENVPAPEALLLERALGVPRRAYPVRDPYQRTATAVLRGEGEEDAVRPLR